MLLLLAHSRIGPQEAANAVPYQTPFAEYPQAQPSAPSKAERKAAIRAEMARLEALQEKAESKKQSIFVKLTSPPPPQRPAVYAEPSGKRQPKANTAYGGREYMSEASDLYSPVRVFGGAQRTAGCDLPCAAAGMAGTQVSLAALFSAPSRAVPSARRATWRLARCPRRRRRLPSKRSAPRLRRWGRRVALARPSAARLTRSAASA